MKTDKATVTTSIKVVKEKRDKAKSMGLNLQDLLDEVLDNYLGLSLYDEISNLENERNDLEKQIEDLEIEKKKELDKINNLYDNKIKGIQFKVKLINEKIDEKTDPFGEAYEKEKQDEFNDLVLLLEQCKVDTNNEDYIGALNNYFDKYGITDEDEQEKIDYEIFKIAYKSVNGFDYKAE